MSSVHFTTPDSFFPLVFVFWSWQRARDVQPPVDPPFSFLLFWALIYALHWKSWRKTRRICRLRSYPVFVKTIRLVITLLSNFRNLYVSFKSIRYFLGSRSPGVISDTSTEITIGAIDISLMDSDRSVRFLDRRYSWNFNHLNNSNGIIPLRRHAQRDSRGLP